MYDPYYHTMSQVVERELCTKNLDDNRDICDCRTRAKEVNMLFEMALMGVFGKNLNASNITDEDKHIVRQAIAKNISEYISVAIMFGIDGILEEVIKQNKPE